MRLAQRGEDCTKSVVWASLSVAKHQQLGANWPNYDRTIAPKEYAVCVG